MSLETAYMLQMQGIEISIKKDASMFFTIVRLIIIDICTESKGKGIYFLESIKWLSGELADSLWFTV